MMKPPTVLDSIFAEHRVTRVDVSAAAGVSQGAVGNWALGKRKLLAETALLLEKKLNIPRWKLRPDLWSPPADWIPPVVPTKAKKAKAKIKAAEAKAKRIARGRDERTAAKEARVIRIAKQRVLDRQASAAKRLARTPARLERRRVKQQKANYDRAQRKKAQADQQQAPEGSPDV
jgi:transcriptional regulator with XRE-family HTH domain